jgi:hypothetical protein
MGSGHRGLLVVSGLEVVPQRGAVCDRDAAAARAGRCLPGRRGPAGSMNRDWQGKVETVTITCRIVRPLHTPQLLLSS